MFRRTLVYAVVRTLAVAFLLICVTPAAAAVDVALGWGGQVRPGRWNVAAVTADADVPRDVVFEWYVPQPGRSALILRQPATVGPTPRTFLALLPVVGDLEAIHVDVIDAGTGRVLDSWPPGLLRPGAYRDRLAVGEGTDARPLIGVSGVGRSLDEDAAYLPPELVPTTPVGFDALDALLLDEPDLSPEQEKAVAAWVRAGGELRLHLGGGPVDPESPLVRLLPALPEGRVEHDGDYYRPLPEVDGFPDVTSFDVGEGVVRFLHVPPDRVDLPAEVRPRVVDDATATVPPTPWRPPLAWVAIAFVVGPLDWVFLRLTGRVRRGRRWWTLPGWVALPALVAVWFLATPRGVTPPEADYWHLSGSRIDGAIRDVPMTLTPRGAEAVG